MEIENNFLKLFFKNLNYFWKDPFLQWRIKILNFYFSLPVEVTEAQVVKFYHYSLLEILWCVEAKKKKKKKVELIETEWLPGAGECSKQEDVGQSTIFQLLTWISSEDLSMVIIINNTVLYNVNLLKINLNSSHTQKR